MHGLQPLRGRLVVTRRSKQRGQQRPDVTPKERPGVPERRREQIHLEVRHARVAGGARFLCVLCGPGLGLSGQRVLPQRILHRLRDIQLRVLVPLRRRLNLVLRVTVTPRLVVVKRRLVLQRVRGGTKRGGGEGGASE